MINSRNNVQRFSHQNLSTTYSEKKLGELRYETNMGLPWKIYSFSLCVQPSILVTLIFTT